MKKIFFFLIACCLTFAACDDSENDVGLNIFPESDEINAQVKNFDLSAETKQLDGVYANNTVYLIGKHENGIYGSTQGALLTGVTYPRQNLTFPSDAILDSLTLRLAVAAHVGREPLRLEVYEMNNKLVFGDKYHTNIDANAYYSTDAKLGSRTFTAEEINNIDTVLANSKVPYLYINLKIEIAEKLKSASYASETAFQDYFKGVYVVSTDGNTMLYAAAADLILKYHIGEDTTTLVFPSNNEVKKVNTISHSNLDEKLSQKPDTITYIYSPAGYYSQITVPISAVLGNICNNSQKIPALNAVRLTIEAETPQAGVDSLALPSYLALLPEGEINTFFEQNKLPDQKASFYAPLVSNTETGKYTYTFDLTYYLQPKIKDYDPILADYADANFVLLPVTAGFSSSSGTLVDLKNEAKLTALSFNNKKLKLTVIYSEFNKLDGQ